MILASAFGCLNANTLVGPRIAYAMAQDRLFFRDAARLSETSRTPWVAVIAQSLTATVLVLVFTEIPRVLDYTTFAIVIRQYTIDRLVRFVTLLQHDVKIRVGSKRRRGKGKVIVEAA